MAIHEPAQSKLTSHVSALEAQIAELRTALSEQQQSLTQVIEQQQAAITALHTQTLRPQPTLVEADATPSAEASAESRDSTDANDAKATKRATSRRGLLRGAAVAGAAAAVAAVVVGGAEQAHAAPLDTGGNFILGESNNADAPTTLTPSSGSAPFPLLSVDNSSDLSPAITAFSQGALGAISADGSSGGTGLFAASDTGLGIWVGGSGRILQNARGGPAGAPTSGSFNTGEQIRDSAGEMWICTAGGSPGTWVHLSHALPGLQGGAITFLASPLRLLDTRGGATDAAITPGARLNPGDNRFPVNGESLNSETIPANAQGVLGNLQTLNAGGAGFISICPANTGFTGTSNMIFQPGQIMSNAFSSAVGLYTTGFPPFLSIHTGIDVFINANPVDVIIDIFAVIL